MKKVIFISLAIFAHLVSANENLIEAEEEVAVPVVPDPTNPDQTLSMVEQMYRSTMVSVLKQKVMDVQRKVVKGENAIPDAIDILKITLLSQPTNNITIRKAAENVFSKISPQLGKAASTLGGLLEDKEASKDD